ncbi:hypothetical protein [Enhygromyxa salina]|uniref:Uncharacterized protein n=1 Tax=Enhygromyxa salina TaxID=215803 RepID=A0A2S9YXI5_9BACT|nr:hypothetical protein [Enhygromyxa salina]PRQ09794.1 hypothetical protein ENSA7_05490 [Enhygromyxa salina]
MKPDWLQTASRLPPSAYRRYLVASGWKEGDALNDRHWRYHRNEHEQDVVVEIPRRQDFVDYGRRVAEVIEVLSLVERRAARAIVFDLGQPEADVLAFRFAGADTESGTISISDSARIREARKQLLLAAAHSIIEPRAHHPRLSRAEAVAFVDTCREAPTRSGSYVSPILVPVSPAVGGPAIEDPFARRVTRLMATALNQAADALTAGEDQRLLEGAKAGLSSNFLAALSALHPPGGQGYTEIAFTWAARRPVATTVPPVRFDHRLFAPLGEAARVLKATSPAPGTEIEGYVRTLDREATDPSQPGEVVLLATVDDRPHTVKVYISLSPGAYAQAMDLHQKAARVRVSGTLVKEGRRHILRSPGELVAVPDDED